jgi:DNA-binding winged helix-turn-helix (wHTH) protein
MPKGLPTRDTPMTSFRLGEWHVEPDLNTISRGSESVHLEIKVMELLVFLASRGSRLVSRRELFDGVWGTEFICDNTLSHAISELRAALGDDAHRPRFIQTIHRRGYRMLQPVTSLEGRELPDPGRPSQYRIIAQNRSIHLRQGANLLGRAPEATVRVDSVWVSRHHARISLDGRAATIEDLNSRNGTFLNERPVSQSSALADGDVIYLGKLSDPLRFVAAGLEVSTESLDELDPTRSDSPA